MKRFRTWKYISETYIDEIERMVRQNATPEEILYLAKQIAKNMERSSQWTRILEGKTQNSINKTRYLTCPSWMVEEDDE